MKAIIDGMKFEGTPEEIARFIDITNTVIECVTQKDNSEKVMEYPNTITILASFKINKNPDIREKISEEKIARVGSIYQLDRALGFYRLITAHIDKLPSTEHIEPEQVEWDKVRFENDPERLKRSGI